MFHDFSNHVKIAVDRLGGPTKVSTMLGIATGTVHTWIKAKRISNIDYAKTVAQASKMELQLLRWTQ
jgi:DNA-binding transcriptional regulator YdaS (Cro superfamily)